jgi:acyl-CoA reductase-like NAD-dependent aldehyde dehydrogenase
LHDIGFLTGIFRFFGSLVDKLPSDFYDTGSVYASTVLEPVGVVGEIVPFNWPPIHTGGKIAPALAVGDTVVIKPSEQAPLTVIRIVELLNTVLPPDVLHVVPGTGRIAGQALVANPLVRMVSFTGSTDAGAAVAQTAAANNAALADGFFVPPTLFTGVTRDMRIATEEIFGPVVTVTAFDTEDEAVAIANEPEYGLLAAVYTRDSELAFRTARRLDSGMVLINNYFRGMLGTPFGGTKHSGYGREHAIATLQEFGYTKMIRFPSGTGTLPIWRGVTDVYGRAS